MEPKTAADLHGNASVRWIGLIILLGAALVLASQSFGVYVRTDDLDWLQRTVKDAAQPWRAFQLGPLFDNYYRPVVHLVWLVNYWLWGFEFWGYQLVLVLFWLGSGLLVFSLGKRCGGEAAGHVALVFFLFHDVSLRLVWWKSWFTILTELPLLLGFALCFCAGTERLTREGDEREKTRGLATLCVGIALGVAACYARELSALLVPTVIFVHFFLPRMTRAPRRGRPVRANGPGRGRAPLARVHGQDAHATPRRMTRRDWGLFAVFLAAAFLILLSLPACRGALVWVFGRGAMGVRLPAVSLRHIPATFNLHMESMLKAGVCRYLLLYLLVREFLAAFPAVARAGRRSGWLFVALFGLFASLFALPFGQSIKHLLVFASIATVGVVDRGAKRLFAAWFAAGLVPFLMLRRRTPAYDMESYIGLSLFAAVLLAPALRQDLAPLWDARERRFGTSPLPAANLLRAIILCILLVAQGVIIMGNCRGYVRGSCRLRQRGIARRATVLSAVRCAVRSDSDRRMYAFPGEPEDLVAMILRQEHGFQVVRARRAASPLIPLGPLDRSLHVYSDAMPFQRRQMEKANLLPLVEWGRPPDVPCLGDRAYRDMCVVEFESPLDRAWVMQSRPTREFALTPGKRVVFGGFLRARGIEAHARVLLRDAGSGHVIWTTPTSSETEPEGAGPGGWQLCCSSLLVPRGARGFVLVPLDVRGRGRVTAWADNLFVVELEEIVR